MPDIFDSNKDKILYKWFSNDRLYDRNRKKTGQRLPAGLFLAVARLCDAFYIVEISAPCLLGPVRIVAG